MSEPRKILTTTEAWLHEKLQTVAERNEPICIDSSTDYWLVTSLDVVCPDGESVIVTVFGVPAPLSERERYLRKADDLERLRTLATALPGPRIVLGSEVEGAARLSERIAKLRQQAEEMDRE